MLTAGLVGRVDSKRRRPVLVYDARCGFCGRWVSRLKKLDRGDAVELMPLQDPEAPSATGRPPEALARAAHLVDVDGRVYAGAAALRELARWLRGGWVIRSVLAVPGAMTLAERVYRWIARRWGPVGG